MNKKLILGFFFLIFIAVTVMTALFLQDKELAVLHPKGMIGLKERDLIIIASLLMLIIVLPVLFLTFYFAWKYRDENKKAKYTPNWDKHRTAEIFWWALPFAIIIALSIVTWKGCHELDPFKPIDADNKPMKIQVVALDWKWLFIYPEHNVASVNFFQIPVGTPVHFEITSDAPMNSFWLPELGGQIFAMSGMKTELHLIADKAGRYRGSSANISGEGFSGMTFIAEAGTQADFERWVQSVKKGSAPLDISTYKKLAEPSSYNPAATYKLNAEGLFDWIVMKYMMPQMTHESM